MNALRLPGSAREASFSLLSRLLLLSPLFFLGQDAMALDIFMHINGTAHRVVLEENDAARDFAARLPLTLTFEDYAATERISYLERKLTLGASPRSTTPKKGDFTYYSPWGNIAVFMKPFRHSEGLVPLGRMDEAALEALRGSGDLPVEFRLAE